MSRTGYPGISLLVLTNLTREHGVEFTPPAGLQDQLTVPWPEALAVMEQLHDAMDEATREAVIRTFVISHPLIRAVAPLTAGVNVWLNLFWALSKGVTTPQALSYEQTEHHHELRISMEQVGPGQGYLQFTRLAAKYAPLAVGVAPLKELSLAEGRSPKQVADELDITVGTVRVHLKQVYAKTDTAGQRELVSRLSSWRLP